MTCPNVAHTNSQEDRQKWLRGLALNRALRNGETLETAERVVRLVIQNYIAEGSAERALRLFAGPAAPCQGAE